MSEKLLGLDLFSGIAGIGLALKPWVRTIAYCEQDEYAQGVLLSRMRSGDIDQAPIFNDVRELFFEVVRLARDLRPKFVFLENVPALTVRGLERVLMEFAALGYDGRWTIVSAEEVGALHKRERIWLLFADSNSFGIRNGWEWSQERQTKANYLPEHDGFEKPVANATSLRCKGPRRKESKLSENIEPSFWQFEPDVGRVVNGLPYRVDRIRCLGNSVVPQAAEKAFKKLIGL